MHIVGTERRTSSVTVSRALRFCAFDAVSGVTQVVSPSSMPLASLCCVKEMLLTL